MASPAVDYARGNQQRFLNELKDLLRIPSISTLQEHKSDVQKAADFVAAELRRIGLEHVETVPTKGHPLIYADWLHAPGKPTVLCYAHYDVQPPDPLNEWVTPPFEPTERNNNIYARGAVDDKGQLWMEVKAIEALMKGHDGRLPLNVKFILEGEEEVGGESIAAYVRKEKAKLKADFALVCDTELFAPDLPTLCVGLRGLVYTEIEAVGAKTDLHSGMYGGAAPNPFFGLIEIISKLKDAKGKILIPGFYKNVKAPSKDELKAWKRLPFNQEHYRKDRSWIDRSDRRAGIFGAVSHLGATHAGSPRYARRICRAGREDSDSGESVGQSFHAPGSQPGPRRHSEALQELCEKAYAEGDTDQHQGVEQRPRAAWSARTTNTSRPPPKRCTMSSKKKRSSSAPAAQSQS